MIIIKDIEIPKSCKKCPMSHPVFGDGWETWCSFTKQNVATSNHNCPLVEIVTCKECKHLCHIEDAPKVLVCGKHNCQQVSKNYYCADGKRRE